MKSASHGLASIFGCVLAEQRKKKTKLSQEDLALECGLDRTYISLLERGQRQPSLKSLFAICSALKISPSEMLSIVEKRMSL